MASSDIVVTPVERQVRPQSLHRPAQAPLRRPQGLHPASRRRAARSLHAGQEPVVRPCRGPVLPGPPRGPSRRPHRRPGRPRLSRALRRRHRPFRLPRRRGRSGDLRRPVRGGRDLAAQQGPEAGDRAVQPLGQRGGRAAGLGLREPPGAAGALRPALRRRARRSLRLRQAEGRLLLRLRRPERARDDRRQADGARRHGRPGQGAHGQHEDVRRRGPHPGRHLQRRLERQLGLRALHPGRDRPCLQGLRAGDRARPRGVRGGRRRGGGLHRGAHQPQRGDRGVQRQAEPDQPARSSCGGSRSPASAAPACR